MAKQSKTRLEDQKQVLKINKKWRGNPLISLHRKDTVRKCIFLGPVMMSFVSYVYLPVYLGCDDGNSSSGCLTK